MDTTKLLKKGNCRMIAHRGVSGLERENTLPAFVAAGNRSYYGIETDVHVTSDGKFVIIHDDTTGRVANGVDVNVETNPLARIRDVRLTDLDGTVGRIDLRTPTLEEYIKTCQHYDKTPILELKSRMNEESISSMIDVIREIGYLDRVVFISFHLDNLILLRRMFPNAKLMFLVGGCNDSVLDLMKTYRMDLDIYMGGVTQEVVDAVHSLGLEINVWTVDDAAMAERLIAMGVDYITSNVLE